MRSRPKTYVLTKTTGWYGSHSGYYEQMGARLAAQPHIALIRPKPASVARRLVGALHSRWLKQPVRNQADSYAELRLRLALWSGRSRGIVLNLDDHLAMLRWWEKAPRQLVGVMHLPPSTWNQAMRRNLRRLGSAILLWRAALPDMEALVGPGRVRFAPHGVDSAFFSPTDAPPDAAHLLMCGQFLRDFPRAGRLFAQLRARHAGLRLTIVVPAHSLASRDLDWARQQPGVELRSGLSDPELRDLYRRCTALLLPLKDSGANNTVVEALACGLPIVTDDLGGIRDYGGGDAFELAPRGDDRAMLALASRYLAEPAFRREVAARQRRCALGLDWSRTLVQFEEAVEQLASGSPDSP